MLLWVIVCVKSLRLPAKCASTHPSCYPEWYTSPYLLMLLHLLRAYTIPAPMLRCIGCLHWIGCMLASMVCSWSCDPSGDGTKALIVVRLLLSLCAIFRYIILLLLLVGFCLACSVLFSYEVHLCHSAASPRFLFALKMRAAEWYAGVSLPSRPIVCQLCDSVHFV